MVSFRVYRSCAYEITERLTAFGGNRWSLRKEGDWIADMVDEFGHVYAVRCMAFPTLEAAMEAAELNRSCNQNKNTILSAN